MTHHVPTHVSTDVKRAGAAPLPPTVNLRVHMLSDVLDAFDDETYVNIVDSMIHGGMWGPHHCQQLLIDSTHVAGIVLSALSTWGVTRGMSGEDVDGSATARQARRVAHWLSHSTAPVAVDL